MDNQEKTEDQILQEMIDMEKSDEKKVQELGSPEHVQRVKHAKEAAEMKKNFKVVKETYKVRGNKIIICQKLKNGNSNKLFGGTKKSNPQLWAKANKGK